MTHKIEVTDDELATIKSSLQFTQDNAEANSRDRYQRLLCKLDEIKVFSWEELL